jgi:hypothetical protein
MAARPGSGSEGEGHADGAPLVGDHLVDRRSAGSASGSGTGSTGPGDGPPGAGARADGGTNAAVGDGFAVADDHGVVPPGRLQCPPRKLKVNIKKRRKVGDPAEYPAQETG